jgi:flagellar motor switch protein FliM
VSRKSAKTLPKTGSKADCATSLVRPIPDAPTFPGLDRVGRKLERGLADLFTGLLALPASVTASKVRIGDQARAEDIERLHVRLAPLEGAMTLSMERSAIIALVDFYYGGEGAPTGSSATLSLAERRLLHRIGEGFCEVLPAAWLAFGAIAAELEDETGPPGPCAIIDFSVAWPDRAAFTLECRFPVAMLESVPGMTIAEAGPGGRRIGNEDWQAGLTASALDIPFAVRAVFAEPWLPLSKLMALKPGDIIPICLPLEIELTVSGRRFASGQAGESGGRAAISLDQI